MKILQYAVIAALAVLVSFVVGCCAQTCSNVTNGFMSDYPTKWKCDKNNLYAYEDGRWQLICEGCRQ